MKLEYWVWLSLCKKSTAEKQAMAAKLLAEPELTRTRLRELLLEKNEKGRAFGLPTERETEETRKVLAHCEAEQISILSREDERYPQKLSVLADPPLVLYYKGEFPDFDRMVTIAVVGTRNCTERSVALAKEYGEALTRAGAYVISGLAAGIDSAAHRGALEAGGTSAVLGCGCDVVYPRTNGVLYRSVAENGALISEYPPGTPANSWNFPRRNRLLSALSSGVLVVESRAKGGSLITAELAREQGRKVFALPGLPDDPSMAGCNDLIREGKAKLVQSPAGLLAEFDGLEAPAVLPAPHPVQKPVPKPEEPDLTGRSELQRLILLELMEGPQTGDQLCDAVGCGAGELLGELTMLQVEGAVIANGAYYWLKK